MIIVLFVFFIKLIFKCIYIVKFIFYKYELEYNIFQFCIKYYIFCLLSLSQFFLIKELIKFLYIGVNIIWGNLYLQIRKDILFKVLFKRINYLLIIWCVSM